MVWGNTTYPYNCAPPCGGRLQVPVCGLPPAGLPNAGGLNTGFPGGGFPMGGGMPSMGGLGQGGVNPLGLNQGGFGGSPTSFNINNPFNLPGNTPFAPNLGGSFGSGGGFPMGGNLPLGGVAQGFDKQTRNALLVDQLFVGVVQSLVQTFMWRQQQKKVKAAKQAKEAKIAEKQQLEQQKKQEHIALQRRRAMAAKLATVMDRLPEDKQALAKTLIAHLNSGGDLDALPSGVSQQVSALGGGAQMPTQGAQSTDINETIGVTGVPPSYEDMMAGLNSMEDGPAGTVQQARERIAKSAYHTATEMNTKGACAAGVGKALRDIGIDVARMSSKDPSSPSAFYMADILEERDDFEEVDYDNKQPGDVLVFGPTDSKVHGHTTVYLGDGQEASDHVQALVNGDRYGWEKAYRYTG